MIIVTGAAGFIGSNIVRGLNARGIEDLIVVDDLTDATKSANLVELRFADYWDKDEFRSRIDTEGGLPKSCEAVFHQGAITSTLVDDGRLMVRANYADARTILEACLQRSARFIYASSAAVYGISAHCVERPEDESPLNVYGLSKLLLDRYVRRLPLEAAQRVVGLRYFNVYGPGERHKAEMASLVYQAHEQLAETGKVRLFAASHGFGDGEQRRDFVHVDDVVNVNLWFLDQAGHHGIFNVGTGRSRSFNALARAVIDALGSGKIEYIPFPEILTDRYQPDTEADLTALRDAGYAAEFVDLETGVRRYVRCLAGS